MINALEQKFVSTGISEYKSDIYLETSTHIPFISLFNDINGYWYGSNKHFDYNFNKHKIANGKESIIRLTNWLDNSPKKFKYKKYGSIGARKIKNYFLSNISMVQGAYYVLGDRKEFLTGVGTIISGDERKVYSILMVKKEYIRYVKLCVFLNEPILENCLEFWVDSGLRSERHPITGWITDFMKLCMSIDIPIVQVNNLISLVQAEIKFKAPTISEQKKLIQNFVNEFKESEKKRLKLDVKNATVNQIANYPSYSTTVTSTSTNFVTQYPF